MLILPKASKNDFFKNGVNGWNLFSMWKYRLRAAYWHIACSLMLSTGFTVNMEIVSCFRHGVARLNLSIFLALIFGCYKWFHRSLVAPGKAQRQLSYKKHFESCQKNWYWLFYGHKCVAALIEPDSPEGVEISDGHNAVTTWHFWEFQSERNYYSMCSIRKNLGDRHINEY